MQIDKAIEIQYLKMTHWPEYTEPDLRKATQLGLEAMRAIRAWRKDWEGNRFHLLPGEQIELPNPHSVASFDSQNR